MTYLYKTTMYKNPQAFGLVEDGYTRDVSDFETNFKSTTQKVESIVIAETTFLIDETYLDFKTKVVAWSSVSYTENSMVYILQFESDTIL